MSITSEDGFPRVFRERFYTAPYVFKQTVKIWEKVVGRPIILAEDKSIPQTDGRTIWLPSWAGFESLEHEIGHILWSNSKPAGIIMDKLPVAYRKFYYYGIYMCFEDHVIETNFTKVGHFGSFKTFQQRLTELETHKMQSPLRELWEARKIVWKIAKFSDFDKDRRVVLADLSRFCERCQSSTPNGRAKIAAKVLEYLKRKGLIEIVPDLEAPGMPNISQTTAMEKLVPREAFKISRMDLEELEELAEKVSKELKQMEDQAEEEELSKIEESQEDSSDGSELDPELEELTGLTKEDLEAEPETEEDSEEDSDGTEGLSESPGGDGEATEEDKTGETSESGESGEVAGPEVEVGEEDVPDTPGSGEPGDIGGKETETEDSVDSTESGDSGNIDVTGTEDSDDSAEDTDDSSDEGGEGHGSPFYNDYEGPEYEQKTPEELLEDIDESLEEEEQVADRDTTEIKKILSEEEDNETLEEKIARELQIHTPKIIRLDTRFTRRGYHKKLPRRNPDAKKAARSLRRIREFKKDIGIRKEGPQVNIARYVRFLQDWKTPFMENVAESTGFEAVLLVDFSGSMHLPERKAVIGISDFLFQVFELLEIPKSAYIYDDRQTIRLHTTETREGLVKVLDTFTGGGGTPTGPALYYVLKEVQARKKLPVIFLLTDGGPDDNSQVRLALDYAEKQGFFVFCVMVSDSFDSYKGYLTQSEVLSEWNAVREKQNEKLEAQGLELTQGFIDFRELFAALWSDHTYIQIRKFDSKVISSWIIRKVANLLKRKRR